MKGKQDNGVCEPLQRKNQLPEGKLNQICCNTIWTRLLSSAHGRSHCNRAPLIRSLGGSGNSVSVVNCRHFHKHDIYNIVLKYVFCISFNIEGCDWIVSMRSRPS
jgi:hypothetical protein